jgi:hypothetical protein
MTVVLDPHRWLELRRFRSLYESGAMSLRDIAKETGLHRAGDRRRLTLVHITLYLVVHSNEYGDSSGRRPVIAIRRHLRETVRCLLPDRLQPLMRYVRISSMS